MVRLSNEESDENMSFSNYITTIKEITDSKFLDKTIFQTDFDEVCNVMLNGKKKGYCYEFSERGLFRPFYRPQLSRTPPSCKAKIEKRKAEYLSLIKEINKNFCITGIIFVFWSNEKFEVKGKLNIDFDDFIRLVVDDKIELNFLYKIKHDYNVYH